VLGCSFYRQFALGLSFLGGATRHDATTTMDGRTFINDEGTIPSSHGVTAQVITYCSAGAAP